MPTYEQLVEVSTRRALERQAILGASMLVPFSQNKPSTPAPEGNHLGRLVRIVDIGSQTAPFNHDNGSPVIQRKIMISWELYTDPMMEDGRPFMVSETYTRSLNTKATLFSVCKAWLGKEFTDALPSGGFNFSKLLGRPCMVTVNHQVSKTGNTFAKLGAVAPVLKGMAVPEQINPSLLFDLDKRPLDRTTLDLLPRFVQEKIGVSPEFMSLNSHPADEDLDVPF